MRTHAGRLLAAALSLLASLAAMPVFAQSVATPTPAAQAAPASEGVLGEFIVTGHKDEKLPRIAILPSLSADLEDVIVRSVVHRDIELTGLFELIPDTKAPTCTVTSGFTLPLAVIIRLISPRSTDCLLYTSDAADE